MILTKEMILDFLKTNGELITHANAEKLSEFVAAKMNEGYLMAPVLYEYPGGYWTEKGHQYFEMHNGTQIQMEPTRRGKIMFVEAVPKKVSVLELVKHLEGSGDPGSKSYAERIRQAGIEQ